MRLLNGLLFEGVFIFLNLCLPCRSRHSPCRKLLLFAVQLHLMLAGLVLFLLPALAYRLVMTVATVALDDDNPCLEHYTPAFWANLVVLFVLLFSLVISVSMSTSPGREHFFGILFFVEVVALGTYAAAVRFAMQLSIEQLYPLAALGAALLLAVLVPVLSGRVACRFLSRYLLGVLLLVLVGPASFFAATVFAVSNTDDVFWGRGTMPAYLPQPVKNRYEKYRTKVLLLFMGLNLLLAEGMKYMDASMERHYFLGFVSAAALLLLLKVLFATCNVVCSTCRKAQRDSGLYAKGREHRRRAEDEDEEEEEEVLEEHYGYEEEGAKLQVETEEEMQRRAAAKKNQI